MTDHSSHQPATSSPQGHGEDQRPSTDAPSPARKPTAGRGGAGRGAIAWNLTKARSTLTLISFPERERSCGFKWWNGRGPAPSSAHNQARVARVRWLDRRFGFKDFGFIKLSLINPN